MFFLAGLIAGAAGVTVWMLRPAAATTRCAGCEQDVASATYYAFTTLDCDESDTGGGQCEDDLESVNVFPTLKSVTEKKGIVTVNLDVRESSGLVDTFRIMFGPDGNLLGVKDPA